MLNTTMRRKAPKKNPYLVQRIMTASPEQLIAYIYDAGIAACIQENKAKGLQAVQELINSLNFKHKEMAVSLYQIYNYVLNQIRSNNYAEAKNILSELRSTWNKAFNLS